jgi:hypothetical protein
MRKFRIRREVYYNKDGEAVSTKYYLYEWTEIVGWFRRRWEWKSLTYSDYGFDYAFYHRHEFESEEQAVAWLFDVYLANKPRQQTIIETVKEITVESAT